MKISFILIILADYVIVSFIFSISDQAPENTLQMK